MSDAELVLRLLVAAALGAIVGVERQLADEPAGFRTHLLVAMGAALFALVSVAVPGDTSRIAAQVVTGIGFLGAAAIIRSGPMVRGLATAASLWVVAAVGVATAYGHWTGALVTTAVAVIVLRVAKRLEVNLLRRWRTKRAELVLGLAAGQDVDAVVKRIVAAGMLVRLVECSDGEAGRSATIDMEVPAHLSPDAAADAARTVAQVRSMTWSV
jgi:putative Mg2+ transporter-C (MgtC) family protein